jgi:hypothetical protein
MTMSVDEALAIAEKAGDLVTEKDGEALQVLRLEVLYRWEQRTALSFRLQDLRTIAAAAGIDEMSPLYNAIHQATATAESWMHPSTLSEAAQSHLALLKRELGHARAGMADLEQRKDGAYLERNRLVAALASVFPSGTGRTAIEGWSEDWHGCVYVDLPTGQASWHFHDSHAHLFAHLPAYDKPWDGHTTEEKYERLEALAAETAQKLPSRFQIGDHVRGDGARGTISGVYFKLVSADPGEIAALDEAMDVDTPTPSFEFPKIFYDIRTKGGTRVGVVSNDVEPCTPLAAVPSVTEEGGSLVDAALRNRFPRLAASLATRAVSPPEAASSDDMCIDWREAWITQRRDAYLSEHGVGESLAKARAEADSIDASVAAGGGRLGMAYKLKPDNHTDTSKHVVWAKEIANQLEWWLRFNQECHERDGRAVDDGMHVIAPEWPQRRLLKNWIATIRALAGDDTSAPPQADPREFLEMPSFLRREPPTRLLQFLLERPRLRWHALTSDNAIPNELIAHGIVVDPLELAAIGRQSVQGAEHG